MWVCATGARHSKSLERRCPSTACLRRGPKIIYSYSTRCALIRDRRSTACDVLHVQLAETEVTCIWKVSVITCANVLIYSCSLPYISHQIGKGGVVSAAIEIVTRVSSRICERREILMPFIIGASVSEAPSCGLNGRAVTIYIDVRTVTATAHARRYAQT